MYSFYGGRPGNSFIIITTYRSIADMVAKFKQGPNYTAVHYDEHVMINTVNKNDPDNGKVYRRGYDFTNTMGGAEYIGTIVGPAGKAPMLEMTTVAKVKNKHASEGYDERFSSGKYSPTDGNLVPGKTGSGTFNDAITWKCCSIRNENDEDATAYIGFTFPYTVIDYETSNVEPYVSGRYADTSSATRVDDGKHPFFEKWHINVPKGVKGDSLKNFRIETASSTVQPYDGQTDDINNNRKILIYDYYNYDNKQDGDPKTFYLGDYNMIEDISMSNDGTIIIQYTHDDNITFSKKLKWINSVNLNTSNGVFTVNYNNGADYSTTLDWIKSVNIENDGTVTFGHVNNEVTEFQNKIKWCTDVQINNNGTITFKWNNGTQDTVLQNKIQWIDAVNLANDGTITVTYNTPDENNPSNPKQQIINTIKWIKSIDLNQTGTLTVTYNTLDQTSTQNPKPNETVSFPNALKSISSVTHTINTKADHGRKGELNINYNNNESDMIELDLLTDVSLDQDTGIITTEWNNDFVQRIGAVNFIKNLAIDSGGNLLVKYSNPQERGDISVGGDIGWTLLGKVAPYGNNTNMTISRILRGKHYLDATDNKVYLEFYIENVGLLRLSDTAIISSGTATMYYNGTKVGSDISLVNKEINSLPDSATTLNTLNFKIELDSSTYPITASNSPHLVDVELKDVVLNIIRENSDDRIADIRDQQRQIDQNTSNISTLNRDLNNIDNVLGNVDVSTKGTLQDQIDKLSAQGAGAHNSIYRGKNLGTSVTYKQWMAIKAGTFDDLYIGDYWKINGVVWRIAAFDYYLHTGDTECTAHHVVIVPDADLYKAKMNDTSTTEGGYVGSAMYKSNLAQAGTAIKSAFGVAHILSHRNYLTNAVSNGAPSGGAWFDSKWDLMTERNVYGNSIFAPATDGIKDPWNAMHNITIDKSQFPLFALRPDMQRSTTASWCWLRDIVCSGGFANVGGDGAGGYGYADHVDGVRPAFCIYQS